ncbi:hypothetical protein [Zhihengliuella salsuginis]|uniref:hypothetical protein n=1 Tax=Zhihengliuella salsuginis TaxID=578222 RepID=UPI0016737421|nr:hypothetical protein [Zhihengliuella salsuginis]
MREEALAYAYRIFDHRRWERVPTSERGAVFNELVADPEFGGPLHPYMTDGEIRVWLKDSVAKEYPRALEGIGGTAKFTARRYPGPSAIIHAALGVEWTVVSGTIEQKPMRCEARGPNGDSVTVFWGPLRGLRDLHWAASRARVLGTARVAIAITRPSMRPLPAGEWSDVEALCNLIGVNSYSVMYAPRTVNS